MANDEGYDGDPFESMIREIFGTRSGSSRRTRVQEEEEEEITLIELKGSSYIILELPGYKASEVFVSVKDRKLEIVAAKKDTTGTAAYLAPKLAHGFKLVRTLPASLGKKWKHTYLNGILEICFN